LYSSVSASSAAPSSALALGVYAIQGAQSSASSGSVGGVAYLSGDTGLHAEMHSSSATSITRT
jgi:hypothetical protein